MVPLDRFSLELWVSWVALVFADLGKLDLMAAAVPCATSLESGN